MSNKTYKTNMEGEILGNLRMVKDPELGFDVVGLGLIYDVLVNDGEVNIKMTLTSMGCPLMGEIVDKVKRAAEQVEGVKNVKVEVVFEPAWSIERVAEEVRRGLGL